MKDFLSKICAGLFAVFAPIKAVMITVGVLILLDLITGIWAAKQQKQRISSAVMRRTISKIVIYQIAVMSGFLLERYILGDTVPVSKIVASVIGLVEFTSILENSNKILGNNVFKVAIGYLGSDNDPRKKKK